MRRIFWILICTSVFPSICFSEDRSKAFEEKYKDEPVIYLLEEHTIELRRDCTAEITEKGTYKIQKSFAKDNYGEIKVDFYKGDDTLKYLKAETISSEGKKKPYYSRRYSEESNELEIAMQDVTVGNTIDYEVKIVRRPFIKGNYTHSMFLRRIEPVKLLRYNFIVPKTMAMYIKNSNTDLKPKIIDSKNKRIYVWEREFVDKMLLFDEFLPPSNELWEYVMISNKNDWKDYIKEMRRNYEKSITPTSQTKEIIDKLVKAEDNPEDKIQKIIDYVQENMRYKDTFDEPSGWFPKKADKILSSKLGVCNDYTILALALLRQAGIKAYPALYCDESRGNPQDWFSGSFFGHVILAIELEGKMYYFDVLIPGYRFKEIPLAMSGSYVLVLDNKEGFFDQIPVLKETEHVSTTWNKVIIHEDGSATGEYINEATRSDSEEVRQTWKAYPEEQKKEYLQKLKSGQSLGEVLDARIEGIQTEYTPVRYIIKYIPRISGIKGYVVLGEGQLGRPEAFFKEKRQYPLYYRINYLDKTINTFVIPKNYKIEQIPKSLKLENPFYLFIRDYRVEGNSIVETQEQHYRRCKVPVQDYENIRKFYDELTRLTDKKILLRINQE